MMEFFFDVIDWMERIPPLWAYVLILVIAYGENVVPPIPGDMVIVFGGYLVGVGKLSLPLVILLATLGGALGFMTMYAIGRGIGHAVLDRNRLRWLPKDQIERVRAWFARWGYWVVAANRFLSGARSVISLTVGMAETDARLTAIFATLSAALWSTAIAFGGYQLGENWPIIMDHLRRYGEMVIIVLLATGTGLLIYRFLANRRGPQNGGAGGGTSARGIDQRDAS